MQQMAQDEYERQRHRLGDLTPEQERAIKSLLASAVNKIAHPVMSRMRRSHDTGEEANMQAWRDIFKLEE
jgi:glutamyl-tRNA reductase